MKRKKEQPLSPRVSKKKEEKRREKKEKREVEKIVQFKTYLLSGTETNLERGHPLLRE